MSRDLSRPRDASAQGFARIMAVFGAVAKDGPLAHDAVCQITGLPRSATFRCLITLEAEGWLTRRLRDGAYRISCAAAAQVGAPLPYPSFVETLAEALPALLKGQHAVADIATLNPDGTVTLLDTTRRDLPATEPFFASPLARAALTVCLPEHRLTIVRAALAQASPEEEAQVTTGRFTRALSQTALDGDIWQPDEGTLTFAIDGGPGAKGALRLEAQGSARRGEARLRRLALTLRHDLRTLLPEPADVTEAYWPALRR